jgi:hypothetical protein
MHMTFELIESKKYVFSGHDSFHCRQLWLKKGFDFVTKNGSFNDKDAVIRLGVGKNMVSSIRFWLKAFNIIDSNDKPTEFGERLLDDQIGFDPFLEDEASLWLLHYQLVKIGHASIYSIIINELRKEKLYFNKETFVNFIRRMSESNSDISFNENTVAKDFIVFTNTYKNDTESKSIEDSYQGVLSELDFLKTMGSGKDIQFFVENNERDSLPDAILLFAILDNANYGNSISLNSLEFDFNSPGSIFALNRTGLTNKISEIVSNNKDIVFTDHAGFKELQFKSKPNAYSILERYYGE